MAIPTATTAVEPQQHLLGSYHLEVLSYLPPTPGADLDIVLVHGAGHSARSWRLWAQELAGHYGWRTHAISLRAHGASGLPATQRSIHQVTLADFADDIHRVFDQLQIDPARAILVGHSLGGYSAQLFAQKTPLKGLALVGSVATQQMYPASLHLYGIVPGIMPRAFLRDASALFDTPKRVRRLLLEPDADAETVQMLVDEMQPEVSFARNFGFILPHRFRPVQTPHVLVLAGTRDAFFSPYWIKKTARCFGVEPLFIDDGPHDLMWAHDPARQAGLRALSDFFSQVAAVHA